jgi:hypothetical protein
MVQVRYCSVMFFLFSLTILCIFIFFFREIFYLLCFLAFSWIFIFFLTFEYASEILAYLCIGLEENLIVHDSSDWAWALFFISFFFSSFLIFPYFLYLCYIWFSNFLIKKEKSLFFSQYILYLYIQILVLIILSNDIFFSTFFYIPKITTIFFEFQLELENYLYLLLGFFFDLNKSLFAFQLIIFLLFFVKFFYLKLKYRNIFLFLISFLLFFYWFGGEYFFSDLILCISIFILVEIVYFLQLILINFRRYIYKS